MKTAIIIQARMTSTRLPGKVLKSVLNKSLLEYQIERLRQCQLVDEIIVATTTNFADDPIVNLCQKLDIKIFRGPEEDVLTRYYHAALEYTVDLIVRITSDCPLIDPAIIDNILDYYNNNAFDYVSNTLQRTYPRGMDTEVLSFNVLEQAYHEARLPEEREHVTPFIYRNPRRFSLGNFMNPIDLSDHRWTVDTMEDLLLISNIIETAYPEKQAFTMEDILGLLELHPGWKEINSTVAQKEL